MLFPYYLLFATSALSVAIAFTCLGAISYLLFQLEDGYKKEKLL